MSTRRPSSFGSMPSREAVCRLVVELERRHFSRNRCAWLLDADVIAGVLTVVPWQGRPPPADPGRAIGQRTDLSRLLTRCPGDLEAVLMDVLRGQVHESSAPGRTASGAEPAWLLER